MTAATPSTIHARVAERVPGARVTVRQPWLPVQAHRCSPLVPRGEVTVVFYDFSFDVRNSINP